jgi:ribonuclease-3
LPKTTCLDYIQGMNEEKLEPLQQSLGYRFTEYAYLRQALTHPSFHNEQEYGEGDYQRLEFLGDSIVGMLLAETLFARFQQADEGELSRFRAQLAEQSSLAGIARSRGVGTFIQLGRGEEQTEGRDKDSILCDVLEAVIAAVYLDGGLEAARRVVILLFDELLDAPWWQVASRDAKSELQELLSARGNRPPEYRLAEESGPPHDRLFRFLVLIGGQVVGEGQGRSKKIAQQSAATRALELLISEGETAA